MAAARARLGDDFLPAYLNCPAWKFVITQGVCGAQPVVGLTIPSVDRVGRYFNFTLATVLEPGSNPLAYVLVNPAGFAALEDAALDILEYDYSKEDLEARVRQAAEHFDSELATRASIDSGSSHLTLSLNHPLPFTGQSAALMNYLFERDMGAYSVWWSGQQGQDQSRLILSTGLPGDDAYLELLLKAEPTAIEPSEDNYIDRIIAGESGSG